MRRFRVWFLLGILGWTGCTADGPLTPGGEVSGPEAPGLASHAFQLTIDLRTGRIDVVQPSGATAGRAEARPAFSLIGSDGVRMTASGCLFTAIPNNPRQKRCTFRLELENLLGTTDLVTPTDFPRPPAGTTGILVFPLSAIARGGSSATAVPSPDWDQPPINFFNDTGACSSGGKSDCYRYEVFTSPMYARGEETRNVGFDVPIDATSVTAYIVVAADLRDNPRRTGPFSYVEEVCGVVTTAGEIAPATEGLFIGAQLIGEDIVVSRSFYTWVNAMPRVPVRVHEAKLRLYNGRPDLHGEPFVEYLPFGTTLDQSDYGLPSILDGHEMNVGTDWSLGRLSVEFEVDVREEIQAAADAGVNTFQFRIRAKNEGDTFNAFYGVRQSLSPTLEVTYSLE